MREQPARPKETRIGFCTGHYFDKAHITAMIKAKLEHISGLIYHDPKSVLKQTRTESH
jgi:hypothetical protein